jgi:hypothetical protein
VKTAALMHASGSLERARERRRRGGSLRRALEQ